MRTWAILETVSAAGAGAGAAGWWLYVAKIVYPLIGLNLGLCGANSYFVTTSSSTSARYVEWISHSIYIWIISNRTSFYFILQKNCLSPAKTDLCAIDTYTFILVVREAFAISLI